MSKNRLMTSVLTVLVAFAVLSCAPDSRTDSPLSPEVSEASHLDQLEDSQDSAYSRTDSGAFTPIDGASLSAQGYTLITEPAVHTRSLLGRVVKVVVTTLSKLLGTDGGVLTILNHVLTVPQGAVTEPTIFSMSVIQAGYVEVELTAVPKSLLQSLFFWRKIEEVSFEVPVELTLSYARATNVTDPSRLKIMRVNPDGNHEILPSVVDPVKQTVTAELDHFSRYCMIAN